MIQFLTEGKNVFNFDPSKEARLGLLPRYAKNESQIRWFTIPPCMIFHTGKYLVACHIHHFHLVNSIIISQVVMNESNLISKDICFHFAQYVITLYLVIWHHIVYGLVLFNVVVLNLFIDLKWFLNVSYIQLCCGHCKVKSHCLDVVVCLLVNAWEEGDEVVLIACRMPTYDFTLFAAFDEDKYEDSRPQL
jgi:hypothetical protein